MSGLLRKNIMLLHGWGADITKLKPLAENLEKLNWRAFIPKIPGFDASPPSNVWGINEYANYFRNEANKFFSGQNYFVFGHSFGGRIAIRIARKADKELEGVILCSSAGLSRTHVIKRSLFFLAAKLGKSLLVFKPLAFYLRRIIYRLSREHDYEKTKGIMMKIFKKIINENQKHEVSKIKIPALIFWGKLDKTTPIRDAHLLNSKIPNSILITYKDSGHRLPYEKAKGLSVEIEKWSNTLN